MKQDMYDYLYKKAEVIPVWKHLGARLAKVSKGAAQVELPYNTKLGNSMQALQGGITTAIADAAGGWALLTLAKPGIRISTIELKISFLLPIREDVVAEGKAEHLGSAIGTSSISVKFMDGRTAAIGIGTYYLKD
jgi:acyl-CoA thioesterase